MRSRQKTSHGHQPPTILVATRSAIALISDIYRLSAIGLIGDILPISDIYPVSDIIISQLILEWLTLY